MSDMTPTEFREALKRQRLTQAGLARLVYTTPPMVCQYASGYHKVPGGLRAFLELRGSMKPVLPPDTERIRQGQVLLRYCEARGLTYKQGMRHITEHIKHMKNARWRNSYNERFRKKVKLWGG